MLLRRRCDSPCACGTGDASGFTRCLRLLLGEAASSAFVVWPVVLTSYSIVSVSSVALALEGAVRVWRKKMCVSSISDVSLVWMRLAIDAELFLRGADSDVGLGLGLGLRLGVGVALGLESVNGSSLAGSAISEELAIESTSLMLEFELEIDPSERTESFPFVVFSLILEFEIDPSERTESVAFVGATGSSSMGIGGVAGSSRRGGVAEEGEETSEEGEGEEGLVMVSLVRFRRCERVRSCCGASLDGEPLAWSLSVVSFLGLSFSAPLRRFLRCESGEGVLG